MHQKHVKTASRPRKKSTQPKKKANLHRCHLLGIPKDSPSYVIHWAEENNADKRFRVSRIKGMYYVYTHPEHTYVGALKEDGVREKKSSAKAVVNQLNIHVSDSPVPMNTEVQIDEYGFSFAAFELCPEQWKKKIGQYWKDCLIEIILEISPSSYLQHLPYEHGRKSYCARGLYEEYTQINLRELYRLMASIYIIRGGLMNMTCVTSLTNEQKAFCRNHHLTLDINADFSAEVE